MPLYYFDLHEPSDVTKDTEGRTLASPEAAYADAITEARGLMSAEIKAGALYMSSYIVVRNADQQPVWRIPFSAALRIISA